MVYAIGLVGELLQRRAPGATAAGSQRCGASPTKPAAAHFELQKTDLLASTFTRVAQELRSQYLLAFVPETLDGKVHKLDVRVKRPGVTVRARKSYSAAADSPTAAQP